MNWQPIKTAPKDGTPVLICVAGPEFYPEKAEFRHGSWRYACLKHGPIGELTHWMPLPEPPK